MGQAAIRRGYGVLYREAHQLLDELADAMLDGTSTQHMELLISDYSARQRSRFEPARLATILVPLFITTWARAAS